MILFLTKFKLSLKFAVKVVAFADGSKLCPPVIVAIVVEPGTLVVVVVLGLVVVPVVVPVAKFVAFVFIIESALANRFNTRAF